MKQSQGECPQKLGKCGGARAFGEDPGEWEIIERMREMRKTETLQAITDTLNDEEITTTRGARWRPIQVFGALRNGKVIAGRRSLA